MHLINLMVFLCISLGTFSILLCTESMVYRFIFFFSKNGPEVQATLKVSFWISDMWVMGWTFWLGSCCRMSWQVWLRGHKSDNIPLMTMLPNLTFKTKLTGDYYSYQTSLETKLTGDYNSYRNLFHVPVWFRIYVCSTCYHQSFPKSFVICETLRLKTPQYCQFIQAICRIRCNQGKQFWEKFETEF